MFKTYIRLLGFASPISKYAVPYFFYAVFYALFNTINFVLIIPILSTLFDPAYRFEPVYELPSTYACLLYTSPSPRDCS